MGICDVNSFQIKENKNLFNNNENNNKALLNSKSKEIEDKNNALLNSNNKGIKEIENKKNALLNSKNKEIEEIKNKNNALLNSKNKEIEEIKNKNYSLLNSKNKEIEEIKKTKDKEIENITNFKNKEIENIKKAKDKEIEDIKNSKKKEIEEFKKSKIKELKENEKIINQNKQNIQKLEKNLYYSKNPILVGLDNIGATCYMNATLQSLSNTTKLSEYFLNKYNHNKNDNSKIMSNEYYKVVHNLWKKENDQKSYAPKSFKEALSRENSLFQGITPNDSKDLINFLLERFHEELNQIDSNNLPINNKINQDDQLNEQKMLNLFLNDFKMKYHSIISDLFYGIMETKNQCYGCKKIKYNFQIYNFIEFPLEQVNKYCFNKGLRKNYVSNNNPDINLYECFNYYGNIELMTGDNQMFCNICHRSCDTLYSTNLYSTPHYLIINLNRGKGAVYKCNVIFPSKLNLLNFVSFQEGNTYFELYAVISHIGPSSMSGHLWLIVKIVLIKNGINIMIH